MLQGHRESKGRQGGGEGGGRLTIGTLYSVGSKVGMAAGLCSFNETNSLQQSGERKVSHWSQGEGRYGSKELTSFALLTHRPSHWLMSSLISTRYTLQGGKGFQSFLTGPRYATRTHSCWLLGGESPSFFKSSGDSSCTPSNTGMLFSKRLRLARNSSLHGLVKGLFRSA